MSRPDDVYLHQVIGDLDPLGDIVMRPYFGGIALTVNRRQFAMFMGNKLYLRVDDNTRPSFVELGCTPFTYNTRHGMREVRAYYRPPADVTDDPDLLLRWAHASLATVLRQQ